MLNHHTIPLLIFVAIMWFAEVIEYARWLGMDPDNEEELLWIAREGIKVPELNQNN